MFVGVTTRLSQWTGRSGPLESAHDERFGMAAVGGGGRQRLAGGGGVSAVGYHLAGVGGNAATTVGVVVGGWCRGKSLGLERIWPRLSSRLGGLFDPVPLGGLGLMAWGGPAADVSGGVLGVVRAVCGEDWESMGG